MRQGFLDLHEYVKFLEREGDLAVVEAEVDPYLEIAEIHRRVVAAEGPALLFLRPKGAEFPVVSNLFGTRRRVEQAFGSRPLELVRRAVELVQQTLPPSLTRLWAYRDVVTAALHLGVRRVRRGPVIERTEEPRLDRLPVLTCWPEDGGPFLTLPLVYTEDPAGRAHNLGIYRMQVYDARTTGMHWQIGKGGGFHYAAAERQGRALPASVTLGGPPAAILAAVAPLPENVPELILASLLLGRRVPVVTGHGPHPLLATAEFALVGEVPPYERRPEGPFGDHYGYYSLRHNFPVFHIGRMFHRKDAFYPATVVSKPRQEDFYIGNFLQELLSPLFPLIMPSVRDLWSYGETGFHSLASARVQERYGREAMTAAFRILGEGQLSLTKFLFVVDAPVDLRDFPGVLTHVLERTQPETDLYVFAHLSMDTLDYTGPRLNEGSKGVWLGLGSPVRDLPRELHLPDGLGREYGRAHVFCPGCLVVGGPSRAEEPEFGVRVAQDQRLREWPLVVISDEPRRTAISTVNFLWTVFTRFEPAADIYAGSQRIARNQICRSLPIVIDARFKAGFPGELSGDPLIAQRVSRRWSEYFPGGVEMGDPETAHLTPI